MAGPDSGRHKPGFGDDADVVGSDPGGTDSYQSASGFARSAQPERLRYGQYDGLRSAPAPGCGPWRLTAQGQTAARQAGSAASCSAEPAGCRSGARRASDRSFRQCARGSQRVGGRMGRTGGNWRGDRRAHRLGGTRTRSGLWMIQGKILGISTTTSPTPLEACDPELAAPHVQSHHFSSGSMPAARSSRSMLPSDCIYSCP